jgi:hypothetical protein
MRSPRRFGRALARTTAVSLLLGAVVVPMATPALAAVPVPKAPAFSARIDDYPRYERENTCSQTEKPGPQVVRNLLRTTYGTSIGTNILRPCTASDSGHEEGRALDWMTSVRVASQRDMANAFISWLQATDKWGNKHAMARRLGIQYIIWNNQMWRTYDPARGWTEYAGCKAVSKASSAYDNACHRNHVHLSFSWDGAWKKTSFYAGDLPVSDQADAVHLTDGSLMVVSRRDDGGVVARTAAPGGTLSAPVDLGGRILGKPAVGRTAAGTPVVAVRGTNSVIYVKRATPQGGWPAAWEKTPAQVTGAAAVVPSGASGLRVFAPGNDGALWSFDSPAAGSWSPGTSIGGRIAPGSGVGAAVADDGSIHVAVAGADHRVWYRHLAGGQWAAWKSLGSGLVQGDVDLSSPDGSSVVAAVWGTDNSPWTSTVDGGVPGAWTRPVATPVTVSPALADRSNGAAMSLVIRTAANGLQDVVRAGTVGQALRPLS